MAETTLELRNNRLTGDSVIIAPARGSRPRDSRPRPSRVAIPVHADTCPFCPGNESETPPAVLVVPSPDPTSEWAIRVVPNRYPIVADAHEVVIESPRHNSELANFDDRSISLLFETLQGRQTALLAHDGTRLVVVFKNRGERAGTSLEHPHFQIAGLNFLPAAVERQVALALRSFKEQGCLLCSVMDEERRDGSRIVFERNGFLAFAPYASAAGEVIIAPVVHVASFHKAPSATITGLASGLRALLAACRNAFGDPDYNLTLHSAPKPSLDDPALHWYWRLTPRLTRFGGFELATGVVVNPFPPEQVAETLRTETTRTFGTKP